MTKLRLVTIAFGCILALTACAQTDENQARTDENRKPTEQKQLDVGENQRIRQLQTDDDTPKLTDGSEKTFRKADSLTLEDLRKKYSSTFLLNGYTDRREVALTFDDGPDAEFTPRVLDELKKAGVHATFFVVGNRVEANPEVFQRIIDEGHAVGNHTYNHPKCTKLSDAEFQEQIIRTDKIIRSYVGYLPSLFRPPYGAISEDQILWLAGNHKKVINWNVDSLDWKGLNADEVYTNVMTQTGTGSIILQHSAGGQGEDLTGTVEAISRIVEKLKQDGINFVTIPDMIDLK